MKILNGMQAISKTAVDEEGFARATEALAPGENSDEEDSEGET